MKTVFIVNLVEDSQCVRGYNDFLYAATSRPKAESLKEAYQLKNDDANLVIYEEELHE